MHELAFFSKNNPGLLLVDHGEEKQALLRHPSTNINYFKELYDTWASWKDVIKEEAIYDAYFEHEPSDQMGLPYWLSLINAAKGRPVFQECRTSGRIGAIKAGLSGYHIYLWRNPWDQWWSYKVTPYFDVATRLIVHSKNAPICVQQLCKELGLPKHEMASLDDAFSIYGSESLSSEQSYLLFYMLWCLALRAGLQEADVLINIDRLSSSEKYRAKIISTLKQDADITDIDFSDCNAPQALYDQRDTDFFSQLEDRVYQLLLLDGWQQQEIETIKNLRNEYQPDVHQKNASSVIASITEQSSRARKLARQWETELARRTRAFEEKLKQADIAKHHTELTEKNILERFDPEIRDILVRIAAAKETKEKTEWKQEKTKTELHKVHQANHYHWTLLQQSESQLNAMRNSYSWRITAPLRWLHNLIAWLLLLPFRMAKAIVLPFAIATMKSVLKRPKIRERWKNRLRKYPTLFSRIYQFGLRRGLLEEQPKSAEKATLKRESEFYEMDAETEARPRDQAEQSLNVLAQRFNEQYKKQLDTLSNRFNERAAETETRSRELAKQSLDILLQRLDEQHKKRLDVLSNKFNEMVVEIETRSREQAEQHEITKTELVAELRALREHASNRGSSQVGLSAEHQKHLESVTEQLNESLGNAHIWYLHATATEQRVHDLLHSVSWRITAPLRWLYDLLFWLLRLPFRMAKAIVLPFVIATIKMVLKRPQMCERWANRLRKYPALFGHMRQFALHKGLIAEQSGQVVATAPEGKPEPAELQALTPRAREIYQELQDAIARNRERK